MPKGAPKRKTTKGRSAAAASEAKSYTHPDASSPLRPDVGVQHRFKKKKPPKTYRYDLRGTSSAPVEAGEQRQIAVKVIDERGNELLVVKALT